MNATVDTIETLKILPMYNFGAVIYEVLHKHIPAIADLSPFRIGSQMELGCIDNFFVFRLTDKPGLSGMIARAFSIEERLELSGKLSKINILDRDHLTTALGEAWYAKNIFTYVGLAAEYFSQNCDSHFEISEQLLPWMNACLIPYLTEVNQQRVVYGMPEPATFDTGKIFPALWVLENEETLTQGTAFMLQDIGLITCEHVFKPGTYAFQANNFSKKYPVTLLKKHSVIDLAILQIDIEESKISFLETELDSDVKQLDQIAVVGYPNYNYGDTGTIVTGIVSGFRTISAIKRILTSAPIIAGNSGGPVLNSQGKVIGVAVTGAERMEEAQTTEAHGIIPIDALYLL